eukprot:scaffold624_cov402-Prasinococcus_capsulatus_cf.AAC.45
MLSTEGPGVNTQPSLAVLHSVAQVSSSKRRATVARVAASTAPCQRQSAGVSCDGGCQARPHSSRAPSAPAPAKTHTHSARTVSQAKRHPPNTLTKRHTDPWEPLRPRAPTLGLR